MGYGAGMRGGEEGEVRFSEWGGGDHISAMILA